MVSKLMLVVLLLAISIPFAFAQFPPPSPSLYDAINVSETTAFLIWDPPKGGIDPVLSYLITYNSIPHSNIINVGDVTTFTFTFLEPNTDYVMSVQGVNIHGAGLPSNSISFTTLSDSTPEPPDPPIECPPDYELVNGVCVKIIIPPNGDHTHPEYEQRLTALEQFTGWLDNLWQAIYNLLGVRYQ